MDLNSSTACYQHCSNGITMCVQNQWAFLKVEILNGFKWSISRRANLNNIQKLMISKCISGEYILKMAYYGIYFDYTCTLSFPLLILDTK